MIDHPTHELCSICPIGCPRPDGCPDGAGGEGWQNNAELMGCIRGLSPPMEHPPPGAPAALPLNLTHFDTHRSTPPAPIRLYHDKGCSPCTHDGAPTRGTRSMGDTRALCLMKWAKSGQDRPPRQLHLSCRVSHCYPTRARPSAGCCWHVCHFGVMVLTTAHKHHSGGKYEHQTSDDAG